MPIRHGSDPKKFWNTINILENENMSSNLPILIKSESVVQIKQAQITQANKK